MDGLGYVEDFRNERRLYEGERGSHTLSKANHNRITGYGGFYRPFGHDNRFWPFYLRGSFWPYYWPYYDGYYYDVHDYPYYTWYDYPFYDAIYTDAATTPYTVITNPIQKLEGK